MTDKLEVEQEQQQFTADDPNSLASPQEFRNRLAKLETDFRQLQQQYSDLQQQHASLGAHFHDQLMEVAGELGHRMQAVENKKPQQLADSKVVLDFREQLESDLISARLREDGHQHG